jgi:hypothetical protein
MTVFQLYCHVPVTDSEVSDYTDVTDYIFLYSETDIFSKTCTFSENLNDFQLFSLINSLRGKKIICCAINDTVRDLKDLQEDITQLPATGPDNQVPEPKETREREREREASKVKQLS